MHRGLLLVGFILVGTLCAGVAQSSEAAGESGRTFFVAPGGSDAGTGGLGSPFATLQRAHAAVRAGDTIYLRGGTYEMPRDGPVRLTRNGRPGAGIRLLAYRGERPVLDASGWTRGRDLPVVDQTADYWTVRGLAITGGPYLGYVCASCRYGRFEDLDVYANDNTGFGLYGNGTEFNTISNSRFHHNYDPAEHGQDADGLAIKFGSGRGNVVRGCRVFANSDDGLDFWMFRSAVTVEITRAYKNGFDLWNDPAFEGNGNGFKLGGGPDRIPAVDHVVRRNLAWGNAANGFDENGNPGAMRVTNNTSYDNGASGFFFVDGRHVLRNNLSHADGNVEVRRPADARRNSWTLPVRVAGNDFRSLDPASVGFLRLNLRSDLVDAGVDVGLPYRGDAPDLGAFEAG